MGKGDATIPIISNSRLSYNQTEPVFSLDVDLALNCLLMGQLGESCPGETLVLLYGQDNYATAISCQYLGSTASMMSIHEQRSGILE